MRIKLLLALVLWGFAVLSGAQTRTSVRDHRLAAQAKPDTSIVTAYIDSLSAYKSAADSAYRTRAYMAVEPSADARYFRIFAPLAYYNSVVQRAVSLDGDAPDDVNRAIDYALLNAYLAYPGHVVVTEEELRSVGELHEEITRPLRHEVTYVSKDETVPDEKLDIPLEIVIEKPNFWTFSGEYYLQFLQNYVSGNWYKGGESNYSMIASATLQANYNNKQKLKFDNKLEMKLGFQAARGDTLHKFKTSEDLIRYTGKLGLQAANNWYYTLQLVAYTQFMRGYKSNDPTVYSDILSPLNVNLSLGMSYSVKAFGGKLTGSIQMSPLAYNFRYVGRSALATSYSLKNGRHTLNEIGSESTFDLTWTISELIKWKTRLYAYTSYKRTEMEWENTFTFQFNKYISSNIFIYPRFDDGSSVRDKDLGYWQFKEYASIGFSYSF